MNKETLEKIQDDELDNAVNDFRTEIYRSLLSCPIKEIKQVDVVFYMSASGRIPKFQIRRVQKQSDVESESLYRNVEKVIEFDKEEILKMREKTNNE